MNTLRHANCCRHLLTILRATCFIASAALFSMSCRSTAAQAQQPNNPQTPSELQKTSPSIPGDPQSAENLAKELLKLKDRLLRLSQGEQNETTKAEIANIIDVIALTGARAQAMRLTEKKPEQVAQAQQLQQMKEQLAEREYQMGMLAKQMMEQQRRQPLPPLENGTVKIYRFVYAQARDAAHTVESLFGTQSLRVAVDERSNLLLVYGKPDVITALDALLSRLDEQASPDGYKKSTQGMASPRSLMLRVFWLSDSMPITVGEDPNYVLPKSVLAAVQKLGLGAPRLVSQTVTALATGKDDTVDFSTNVPAMLLDQPVGIGCEGKLKLVADDRVRVDMEVHVGGQTMNCDLKGSMATPLGHYMVLGTANSMIPEGGSVAGGMAGAPGMAVGRGAMGPGGGFRQPGPGSVGPEGGAPLAPGSAVPGGAGPAGEFAGPTGAAVAPQTKPKYETSRFAFVVQVIEGQSYGAEKAKPEGE